MTPTPISAAKPQTYSADELKQLADTYLKFLILGAAWLVYACIPLPESFQPLEKMIAMVSLGCWIRFNWRLSRLLRKNCWVWTALAFIPLVNYIAWGRLLWLAAQTLRANGVPCGFMGADQAALNRLGKTA